MRKVTVLKEGMKVIIALVMVAIMVNVCSAFDQRITDVEQQVEETKAMDRAVLNNLKEIMKNLTQNNFKID